MGQIITGWKNILANWKEVMYARKHLQESNLQMHGDVWDEVWRDGKIIAGGYQGRNTFTTLGMNWMLDECFNAGATATGDMYIGIFKNNVTPALADTAAKLGSGNDYGECQDADYDLPLTNRDAYTVAAASGGVITNTADKGAFTIAATITVYGAFLVTDAAKTSVAGTLISAKKFTASRAVVDDDVLNVLYQITMTTS